MATPDDMPAQATRGEPIMPDDDANRIPETTSALSARRGYWAGFRDLTFIGRPFWALTVLLAVFAMAKGSCHMLESSAAYPSIRFHENPFTWIRLGASVALIVLGSVLDWLGTRRTMLVLFSAMAVLLGITYAAHLFSEDALSRSCWIAFFSISAVLGVLASVAQYRVIRRHSLPAYRAQAIVAYDTISMLLGGIVGTSLAGIFLFLGNADSPRSEKAVIFTIHAFPIAIVLLAVAFGFTWKRKHADEQLGPERDDTTASAPATPFSGWKDVLNAKSFKAVLLFAVALVFIDFALQTSTIVQNHLEAGQFEGGDRSKAFIQMSILTLSPFLPIIFWPIIHRIAMGKMVLCCAVVICIGTAVLAIPQTGLALIAALIPAVSLVLVAQYLLYWRFLEYALATSPVGREGSLAAGLGIVWLFGDFSESGMKWLLETQSDAAWTHAIRDAINPEASAAHPLWLILLIPVLLGTILLFVFRKYLFGEEKMA